MELGTFERQLRLMVMLTQNRSYTHRELCERLNVGWRTVYRYIELFRDMGFVMIKEHGCWRIDRSSPFFREINRRARDTKADSRLIMNMDAIRKAVDEHKVVVLRGYHSANSRTVSDRTVEPFQILENGDEVRCYESMSHTCKTFKISRADAVEVQEQPWREEARHVLLLADAFGFTSERQQIVILRLGALALDLLHEEYPKAVEYLRGNVLTIPVSSFLGVGRFVMGLPEEVEIIGNEDFKKFVAEKLAILEDKIRNGRNVRVQ